MARLSRFQNLEHERPAREGPAAKPQAELDRFKDDPNTPSPSPALAPTPLERFESTGERELRINRDDLAQLPSIECGACGTDNGKFDLACLTCGSRLDTEATQTRNLARLTELTRHHDAQRVLGEQRHAAEIERAAAERNEQRRLAESLAREAGQRARRQHPLRASSVLASGLLLVAILSHSIPLALGALVGSVVLVGLKVTGVFDSTKWL